MAKYNPKLKPYNGLLYRLCHYLVLLGAIARQTNRIYQRKKNAQKSLDVNMKAQIVCEISIYIINKYI